MVAPASSPELGMPGPPLGRVSGEREGGPPVATGLAGGHWRHFFSLLVA